MDKKTVITFSVLTIIVAVLFYQNIRLSSRIERLEVSDSIEQVYVDNSIELPDSFDYVYNRFEIYNPELDTETVVLFLKSIDQFSLRDGLVFDLLVGQIMLESQAKQFYIGGHAKHGEVIRGASGEVGIAQIMPTTAMHYLKNVIKDDGSFKTLGVSDYSFMFNKHLSKQKRYDLTVRWLTDIKNNLALWGFIMRDNLRENGVLEGFVAYNVGKGGLKRFLRRFRHPNKHRYIKSIKDTLDYTSGLLSV
jgi:hypothetical protein|tara:strand:+ start:6243 stop:6989 length:747 start_codon:yes stop_codon:yes gene_type:complete